MDCLYDLRTCQIQTLIVAFKLLYTISKRTAVVVSLCESVSLYHGAHRTVQNIYLVSQVNHNNKGNHNFLMITFVTSYKSDVLSKKTE